MFEKMKGWRTVAFNIVIGAGTAALNYMVGFDWVSLVGADMAVFIVAALNIALRYITDTPVGSKV